MPTLSFSDTLDDFNNRLGSIADQGLAIEHLPPDVMDTILKSVLVKIDKHLSQDSDGDKVSEIPVGAPVSTNHDTLIPTGTPLTVTLTVTHNTLIPTGSLVAVEVPVITAIVQDVLMANVLDVGDEGIGEDHGEGLLRFDVHNEIPHVLAELL
jgi:hypothetical protein